MTLSTRHWKRTLRPQDSRMRNVTYGKNQKTKLLSTFHDRAWDTQSGPSVAGLLLRVPVTARSQRCCQSPPRHRPSPHPDCTCGLRPAFPVLPECGVSQGTEGSCSLSPASRKGKAWSNVYRTNGPPAGAPPLCCLGLSRASLKTHLVLSAALNRRGRVLCHLVSQAPGARSTY